ncbi:hypothetical protein [Streptomyces sp. NPDC001388]|uniref:hypothetical protein n=1 Tax=Streptomyces sp. NPDC001388 TaxID=3364568 RepID=UPI0036C34B1F
MVDENGKRRHQRDDGSASPPERGAASAAWPVIGCRHGFRPCSICDALTPSMYPGGVRSDWAGLVTSEDKGHELKLGLPTVLPGPRLDGAPATYAGVLPDVDLKLTALGSASVLVVKTAEAAKNPALATATPACGRAGEYLSGGRKHIGCPSHPRSVAATTRPTFWRACLGQPTSPIAQRRRAIQGLVRALHARGITGYTEPGLGPARLRHSLFGGVGTDTRSAYTELAAGELHARVSGLLLPASMGGSADDPRKRLEELRRPASPDLRRLNAIGVTISADGVPPNRTVCERAVPPSAATAACACTATAPHSRWRSRAR